MDCEDLWWFWPGVNLIKPSHSFPKDFKTSVSEVRRIGLGFGCPRTRLTAALPSPLTGCEQFDRAIHPTRPPVLVITCHFKLQVGNFFYICVIAKNWNLFVLVKKKKKKNHKAWKEHIFTPIRSLKGELKRDHFHQSVDLYHWGCVRAERYCSAWLRICPYHSYCTWDRDSSLRASDIHSAVT